MNRISISNIKINNLSKMIIDKLLLISIFICISLAFYYSFDLYIWWFSNKPSEEWRMYHSFSELSKMKNFLLFFIVSIFALVLTYIREYLNMKNFNIIKKV